MAQRQQTILFGNGINRLSPDCPSWSDLLAGIDQKTRRCENFDKIPFTFQYEVLLPDEYIGTRSAYSTAYSNAYAIPEVSEKIIKDRICERLSQMKPNPFYKKLAELGAANYVTTNYEYLLHQAFEELGCLIEFENSETRYSIRRRATATNRGGKHCNIWSIHGELNKPNSMMLGLDHYIESTSRMEEYIKGKYDGQHPRYDSIEKRLLKGELDDEISWIDLFFYTDVHIIGHGLDYSETDIWWLLNRRMRLFKKLGGQIKPNTITYYGQLDPDKAHLLEKFGVDYQEVPVIRKDYAVQYYTMFQFLQGTL